MGFALESFYIGIIYDIKLMSYQQLHDEDYYYYYYYGHLLIFFWETGHLLIRPVIIIF